MAEEGTWAAFVEGGVRFWWRTDVYGPERSLYAGKIILGWVDDYQTQGKGWAAWLMTDTEEGTLIGVFAAEATAKVELLRQGQLLLFAGLDLPKTQKIAEGGTSS